MTGDQPSVPSSNDPVGQPVFPSPPGAMRPPGAIGPSSSRDPADPGSRPLARFAMVVVVVLLVVLAVLQQLSVSGRDDKADPSKVVAGSAIVPPSFDNQMFVSRLVSKFSEMFEQMQQPKAGLKTVVDSLDQTATSEADRTRLIAVIGFNVSPESAVARADELLAEAPAALPGGSTAAPSIAGPKVLPGRRPLKDPVVRADAELFRKVYQTGDASKALTREEAAGLNARHGFYGELANIHGLAPGDQTREALLGGGMALIVVLTLVGFVVLIAFFTGLVMFIITIVRFASGRMPPKFVPPTPGGSVPIELVAIFLTSFLMLKVGSEVLHASTSLSEKQLTIIALLAQWSLAAVIFYPFLRGLSGPQWKAMLGLQGSAPHRSVLREVGVGILSYLTILPVFIFSALVAFLVLVVSQFISQSGSDGDPPPAPTSPLFELFSGSPFAIILLASLTMLWAPLVEEVVFRGALFRHLRGRWSVPVAALLSALVFALLHQYHVAQLIPVFTLGFCFALVREWRGSLIPSMVCHCIHNSFVTIVLIMVISLLT